MAFQLSKLKSKTMKGSVTFGEQRLNFEYFPGKLTEDWYDRVQFASDTENMADLKDAILDIIASWDLMVPKESLIDAGYFGGDVDPETGEREIKEDVKMLPDEMMCPLKVEAIDLLEVPLPIFGLINNAVQEDARSGGKNTKKAR